MFLHFHYPELNFSEQVPKDKGYRRPCCSHANLLALVVRTDERVLPPKVLSRIATPWLFWLTALRTEPYTPVGGDGCSSNRML